MQVCRICFEKISLLEKMRGTCYECEKAIAKVITNKMIKYYSYPRKIRFKN